MNPNENISFSHNTEYVIYLMRCLHRAFELPISLFHQNEMIVSIPENHTSGYSLLNDPSLLPDTDGIREYEDEAKIFKNRIGESAIILNIPGNDDYLLVGPLLTESIESGVLTNMVRNGLIPFHQKSIMQSYFNDCPVLSSERLFYIGKLMEELFYHKGSDLKDDFSDAETTENIKSETDEASSQEKRNASYFRQIKKYREDVFLHSPYSIEQKICHTISSGDTENAKRLLTDINLVPHARLASDELRSYKNSIICSCTFMARAAIAGGVNPDDAFTLSDSYINHIETTHSIKQLHDFESHMIEGFTEKVRSSQNQTYSSTILHTIYYIENHLCEDLPLSLLAKEAYVNPGYLSELFHKETGLTITEWIKKKRIEESAIFVLDRQMDFAEIASFYHFCSQSYFSKCFKKIMGVTPGEYRKKNGKF